MKSGIVGVDDLEGVGIVIIAAAINEKAGGERLIDKHRA